MHQVDLRVAVRFRHCHLQQSTTRPSQSSTYPQLCHKWYSTESCLAKQTVKLNSFQKSEFLSFNIPMIFTCWVTIQTIKHEMERLVIEVSRYSMWLAPSKCKVLFQDWQKPVPALTLCGKRLEMINSITCSTVWLKLTEALGRRLNH